MLPVRSPPLATRNNIVARRLYERSSLILIGRDAFYASLEQRDDPQRAQAVMVAWRGNRSVVCAASCLARSFGVHSAFQQCERNALSRRDLRTSGFHALSRRVPQRAGDLGESHRPDRTTI